MSAHALPRIGIVTGRRRPDLTDDGRALQSTLRERGYVATPTLWHDPTVDWRRFDGLVVRSCWAYRTDPAAFRRWISRIDTAETTVVNPPAALRWNLHKGYLTLLEDAGVATVPTRVVTDGDEVTLQEVVRERGWEAVVIKPAIGTSSAGVWHTATPSDDEAHRRFGALRDRGDVVVQRFEPAIADGEDDLVFIGGAFSHAWRSVPDDGDFRTFGGSSAPIDPPERALETADVALQAAADLLGIEPTDLAYARVDGIDTDAGWLVNEVELIEPYLGLARGTDATSALAAAIDRQVGATAPIATPI